MADRPTKRPRVAPTTASAHDENEQHETIDLTESPPSSPSPQPQMTQTPLSENSSAAIAPPLGFRLTKLKDAPASHNTYAVGLSDLLFGEFSHCLLTNYMFDLPWLFSECPRLRDVPVVLVHGERDRSAMAHECRGYENVTPVAPRLPIPYGTHHTKMMVVVYESHVHVVICTANFISIDWNNKTQGVWMQDFPLEQPVPVAVSVAADDDDTAVVEFERDLVDYLSTLGAPAVDFCKRHVQRFDFSTANVALLPSVPGVHTGKAMDKYGHLRVRKLLQHFKIHRSDHPLVCQFSSMGSLDEKWLFGEFAQSLMPGDSTQLASGGGSLPIKAFHIIWPAVEDVRNSVEGWHAGRALPCPLKNMKPFLHKYLRKWTPPAELHRQNAMPHIKSYARIDPSQNGSLDWAILSSANLSKAAWGALQKNKSQFMIRSYELGVLFLPVPPLAGASLAVESKASAEPPTLAVLGSSAAPRASVQLPLPYGLPIKTYDPKHDEPWVWDLVREAPDVYGNCYIPR